MTNSFVREDNPNWHGGRRVDGRGYIEINVGLGHPMASKNRRYVGEHRLVMAAVLGRWLTSDEIVHHKDEDKQNNDPANLELRTRAEHMRIHYANKPRPSAVPAWQPEEEFALVASVEYQERKQRLTDELAVPIEWDREQIRRRRALAASLSE
jgi:hypothetical protein